MDGVHVTGAMERHEPWCDRRQHALAVADAQGPSGCVSRYVEHGTAGGWVTDDVAPPAAGSRLVVDWQPAEGWNSLTPEEAADLRGLLDRLLAEHRRAASALSVVPRRPVAGNRRRSA